MMFCDVTLYFYATRKMYIQSPVGTYWPSLKRWIVTQYWNHIIMSPKIDYDQEKCWNNFEMERRKWFYIATLQKFRKWIHKRLRD